MSHTTGPARWPACHALSGAAAFQARASSHLTKSLLPAAHPPTQHEQAREAGNDAYALGDWDGAVAQYSRALELRPTDAALWSNRAAAYLAKGW